MKIASILTGVCAGTLLLSGCMTEEPISQRAAEDRIELIEGGSFKIELLDVDAGADKLQVVHFGEDGAEKVTATANENAVVTFSTGEFSVFGFGNVLEPIDTVETDEASVEILGFGTETQVVGVDAPEVEEGLEVLGANHATPDNMVDAIQTLVTIFDDTLGDTANDIKLRGFIIGPTEPNKRNDNLIITFDNTADFVKYVNEHKNTKPDDYDAELFDAFSTYISTVTGYIGKS